MARDQREALANLACGLVRRGICGRMRCSAGLALTIVCMLATTYPSSPYAWSCADQEGFLDAWLLGCDAYASTPSLCVTAVDAANGDGVHAGMACCECGGGSNSSLGDTGSSGGYIDGLEGLSSSCQDQEGFLDLELWGCDEYAEHPASCVTAADYANGDGVHAGMACCECGGGYANSSPGGDTGSTSTGATAVVTCSGSCACTPSAGTTSGQISDGLVGPMKNYDNNANCIWVIASDGQISLSFTLFETEANFDFVHVYRCDSASCSTREQIAQLSGSTTYGSLCCDDADDATYTSSTGYLQVVFTSDGAATEEGFVAEWTSRPFSTVGNSETTTPAATSSTSTTPSLTTTTRVTSSTTPPPPEKTTTPMPTTTPIPTTTPPQANASAKPNATSSHAGSGSFEDASGGSGWGDGSASWDLPASIRGLMQSGYSHCSMTQAKLLPASWKKSTL